MGHRHLFCTSQTSDIDRGNIWNHPHPDTRLHLDYAAVGVNLMPYFDNTLRSNDLPSSTFSSEIPNYGSTNPGTSHGPYLHPSSASSSNRIPPNYIQTGPSCYNRFAIGDASIQMDYGRSPFKRKIPALSMAFDRGNTNGHYTAGSSSNLTISSTNLQPNPTSGPQYWAWDPISMPPSYRSNNLLTAGEGSQRNVRSRQSHALHLENNPNGAHASSNLPHHLHPMVNISGLTAAGQWSHTPVSLDSHRRILSSDAGCFNHEMNQSLAGSSSTSGSVEIVGGYHPNLVHSRSSSTTLPTLHGLSSQVMGVGRHSYDQRTTPYRAISSYHNVGFGNTLEDGRWQVMEAVPPSRHSRPLSIIGQSSERNGRSRSLYDRNHPFSDGDNARSRWVSQGEAMMNQSTFYDSRNLFDQHHDMRLDIDNMSYEELLALEERIGNVGTGLSEDTISRCLVETVYSSSNQIQDDQEEENCVICLEEYKDKESLRRLTCGHDFHANCIKKWLLIKNVCPICKASALPHTLKEK